MLVLITVWHDWSIVTAAKTKCPINLQSQSVAQQYLFFHSAESLFTSLTHCNVLLGIQLHKSCSRPMGLLSEITVTCTTAGAFLSILNWSESVGLSMNLGIVLVFVGVLADCNKPSYFSLAGWGLLSLAQWVIPGVSSIYIVWKCTHNQPSWDQASLWTNPRSRLDVNMQNQRCFVAQKAILVMSSYGNYLQCFHLQMIRNPVLLDEVLIPKVRPLR